MAEGEHKLLASKNTSRAVVEQILPNGTALEFLNATHIQRHQELLAGDDSIGQEELRNLAQHIAKDVDNLKKKMMQDQAQQMQMAQQMMQGQQGKPGQPPQGPQPQPAPTQPGQLQVGEGLGLV
jgi:Sec-independent protein translocase protein TatA